MQKFILTFLFLTLVAAGNHSSYETKWLTCQLKAGMTKNEDRAESFKDFISISECIGQQLGVNYRDETISEETYRPQFGKCIGRGSYEGAVLSCYCEKIGSNCFSTTLDLNQNQDLDKQSNVTQDKDFLSVEQLYDISDVCVPDINDYPKQEQIQIQVELLQLSTCVTSMFDIEDIQYRGMSVNDLKQINDKCTSNLKSNYLIGVKKCILEKVKIVAPDSNLSTNILSVQLVLLVLALFL